MGFLGKLAGGIFGGLGGGLVGVASRGSSLPNPYNNGARYLEGNPGLSYLQQNPEMLKNIFQPYIDNGFRSSNAIPGLHDRAESLYENTPQHLEEMANNPSAFLDKIFAKYKPSEGYKFKENRLLKEAGNTAAAYGMAGTENDVENRTGIVNGILSQDMQEYLKNILGIQETGQAGNERYLEGRRGTINNRIASEELQADRGANAANNYAGLLSNNNTNMAHFAQNNSNSLARLAISGQRNENRQRNQRRNSLLNAISGGFNVGSTDDNSADILKLLGMAGMGL